MHNKSTRLARALRIRDIAVEVAKRHGTWQPVVTGNDETINVLQVEVDGLEMLLRTPFQRLPDASERMKYLAALNNVTPTRLLPYGLDVWSSRKKVLGLSWDENGIELTKFQTGPWEAELEELAELGAVRRDPKTEK